MLNEEGLLQETLSALPLTGEEEIIVVDGGSTDGTADIAARHSRKVFATRRGRGHQMNFGAARAEGDIFLFLHADCRLPEEGFSSIRGVLRDRDVAAGAFDIRINHPKPHFRLIERGANLRSRLTSIPYGDQGIFMRRETFLQVKGFADLPLMEDIEISRRLKRAGRIAFIRPPLTTSPRRWLKEGPLYTTLRDWTIALSFTLFRVSPHRLIRYYQDIR